jgi:4-amino-4-deoxy-L-arabinose transferase-like glycosyltransferase
MSDIDIERNYSSHACNTSEKAAAAGGLWNGLALFVILSLAAALRLWRLGQNGWGNEYYTAGVRSMMGGWSNFLYNSFDPAGFVSVDKPPVALWIQVVSAKLFGFHGLAVLLPQVLEGIIAVWVMYHIVRRYFDTSAGLFAALFLAITPVSVAIDRSSNTDSCLVLVILLAAWALIRAAETGRRRFLLLSLAIIGVGFNVKMLAAFVVLPSFVLVYFLAAPITWRRRLQDLAIAAVVLIAVSLSWLVIYDLTPPENRPFAGTTKNNSMLELAFGPYAVGRFVPPIKPAATARGDRKSTAVDSDAHAAARREFIEELKRSNLGLRLFVLAPAGPLRLADGQLAGQVGWLIPLAIIGGLVAAFQFPFRRPIAKQHALLLLWFCWTVTYVVIYSYAAGIMHLYYLATLAPSLASLAGIGIAALWKEYVQKTWTALLLPAALLLTAAWQLRIQASALGWKLNQIPGAMSVLNDLTKGPAAWQTWLHAALIAGTFISAASLLGLFFRERRIEARRVLAIAALGIGIMALLVTPLAWALSIVLVPGHGTLPSADLARLTHPGGKAGHALRSGWGGHTDNSKLIEFLKANHRGERYLLATSSAPFAASIIIRTGEAVMVTGGFHGLDPILTPEKFAHMVKNHQVRFAMLGDLSRVSRMLGAESAGRPIADWVEANGKLVDFSLWRSPGERNYSLRLYDLRPKLP